MRKSWYCEGKYLEGAIKMKYYILIHEDNQGGYWGECPDLPGCFSQGETQEDLMNNIRSYRTVS
jgi:hypothetical protein